MSNEEKFEHQRVLKDLEKQTIILTVIRDEKERIEEELKVLKYCYCDNFFLMFDIVFAAPFNTI